MRWLVLMLALGACDAFSDPNSTAACQGMADDFVAAAQQLDDSCVTAADCLVTGGQSAGTCDCTPSLPEVAVNRNAYDGSHAADLENRWRSLDCQTPGTCDQAPPDVACVDHRCHVTDRSCLDQPLPDAAP